jgi:hypothetical protein
MSGEVTVVRSIRVRGEVAPHDVTVAQTQRRRLGPCLEQRVMEALARLGSPHSHHYPIEQFDGVRVLFPNARWVDASGREREVRGHPTTSFDGASGEILWRLEDAAGIAPSAGLTTYEPREAAVRRVRAVCAGRWTPTFDLYLRGRSARRVTT